MKIKETFEECIKEGKSFEFAVQFCMDTHQVSHESVIQAITQ